MENLHGLDGEVIEMDALNAIQNVGSDYYEDDFYPFLGVTKKMVAVNAIQNVGGDFNEDLKLSASGEISDVYAKFDTLPSWNNDDDDYSNLYGQGKARREQRRSDRQKRRSDRQTRKNEKATAKNAETLSRAQLNVGLSQEKQSDIELAKAIGMASGAQTIMSNTAKGMVNSLPPSSPPNAPKNNTGLIIGISVGAIVIIAASVLIYKSKSK